MSNEEERKRDLRNRRVVGQRQRRRRRRWVGCCLDGVVARPDSTTSPRRRLIEQWTGDPSRTTAQPSNPGLTHQYSTEVNQDG
ncbi:hypothetical protein RRF57_011258 [Xylaria bambusicola]|uniref:Uncharacterized protein n=1 Tax=Xylaria bambusicola TaxID=326684 RepID=A0AAN7UZ83_9PEZI